MTAEERKAVPRSESTEFDTYAPGYAAGMDNKIKALLGECSDDFQEVKLNWLLRAFPALRSADGKFKLLDYGCGSAALLRLIAGRGVRATLAGCDISAGMLAEGVRTWPREVTELPELVQQMGAGAPFGDATFDLVVISAVLHHVPPAERGVIYPELCRLLQPGGHVVVFEHNPLNPVTRFVVSRTPIDRNAILLRPGEVMRGLGSAGLVASATSYLMFAPPRLRLGLDEALWWLPLGAQYAVIARRPLPEDVRSTAERRFELSDVLRSDGLWRLAASIRRARRRLPPAEDRQLSSV
jgi:SAM-dependent methyltransferase